MKYLCRNLPKLNMRRKIIQVLRQAQDKFYAIFVCEAVAQRYKNLISKNQLGRTRSPRKQSQNLRKCPSSGIFDQNLKKTHMATTPEFRDYILDLLEPIYPVRDRKMFGGVGLFIEEGMFALITAEDVLHFKVDDENRADYEAAGMPRFARMPYYQVPLEVMESPDDLRVWMGKAIEVARRAAKAKK
jgi:DNA transformation protein